MNSEERRKKIAKRIENAQEPISATVLAKEFSVSRQSIVGDVGLLRAKGVPIAATPRGYIMEKTILYGQYLQKIVCQHSVGDTADELKTIVELGGEVLNVIVEHELYGEFTGQLNIVKQSDIDAFISAQKASNAKYLSELTGGIHTHLIGAQNKETIEHIKKALLKKGYLYQGD